MSNVFSLKDKQIKENYLLKRRLIFTQRSKGKLSIIKLVNSKIRGSGTVVPEELSSAHFSSRRHPLRWLRTACQKVKGREQMLSAGLIQWQGSVSPHQYWGLIKLTVRCWSQRLRFRIDRDLSLTQRIAVSAFTRGRNTVPSAMCFSMRNVTKNNTAVTSTKAKLRPGNDVTSTYHS